MGLETAIFGGLTAATTYAQASAQQQAAQRQNAAIGRSQESLYRSTQVTQDQLVDAAQLERLKVARQAAQIEGRIRAARATAGQGMSGTTLALIRQNDITEAENLAVIGQNLRNQIAQVRSGYDANMAQLSSGLTDPGMAMFTGALSGLNTGLNITSGIMGVRQYLNTPKPTRDDFMPINIL